MKKIVFKKLDLQDPKEWKSFLHARKLSIQENYHTDFLWGNAVYQKKNLRKKHVFVLKEDNEVIGMIFYSSGNTVKTSHVFTLANVYILSSKRGRGYGHLLLAEMEKYICKHFPLPIIKLDLLVTETNTKAIALYKKIGFKKIGLDPMRVCDGKKYLGLYLMTKIIKNK